MLALLTAYLAFRRFKEANHLNAEEASAEVTRLIESGASLERMSTRLAIAAAATIVLGIITMWLATANVNAYTSLSVALAAHDGLVTEQGNWIVAKAVADLSFWVTIDEAATWVVVTGLVL